MPAALILNQTQAEAVYSAMCALGSLGIPIDIRAGVVRATETEHTGVLVSVSASTAEQYDDQATFAAAYGLNINEAPVEPAAQSKCPGGAACGWDDKAKMGDICRVCGEQVPF